MSNEVIKYQTLQNNQIITMTHWQLKIKSCNSLSNSRDHIAKRENSNSSPELKKKINTSEDLPQISASDSPFESHQFSNNWITIWSNHIKSPTSKSQKKKIGSIAKSRQKTCNDETSLKCTVLVHTYFLQFCSIFIKKFELN